ncbi:hypothetical protein GEMRC1_010574 [Eukaryota sp. GEM-RC1]
MVVSVKSWDLSEYHVGGIHDIARVLEIVYPLHTSNIKQLQLRLGFFSQDALDVVLVSAVHCCYGPNSYRTGCSYYFKPQINIQLDYFFDIEARFNVDNDNSTAGSASGRASFEIDQSLVPTTSLQGNTYTLASSIELFHFNCTDDLPHKLDVVFGKALYSLCIDTTGEMELVNATLISSSVPQTKRFSTGTRVRVNHDDWYMFFYTPEDDEEIAVGEEKKKSVRFIKNVDGEYKTSETSFDTVTTDSNVAVANYDFDGDGVDDLFLVECNEDLDCNFRHSIIFDSDLTDEEVFDANYFDSDL